MYEQLSVNNNEAANSFEMNINGECAFIEYKKKEDVYLLIHTEVPKKLQGQGIAATLVEKTFNYLEEHHLKMVPYCAYIQAHLKKHPEWQRLIAKQV